MTEPTYTPQCPVCGAAQAESLLCHADTLRLEQALGDVRSVVEDLDIALSKQARIGTPGRGGLARERNPIHHGAMEAGSVLANVLAAWVIDVCGEDWPFGPKSSAVTFARDLLNHVPEMRRHPAVEELLDQITDAVEQARRAVDRPADRQYLGQCYFETEVEGGETVTCYAEIWGRPDSTEVSCRVCGITHVVEERRAWLLLKAADMLCTVKEASRYMGDVGGVKVTEASIRGYIHRQRLAYRAGTTTFRLGDLLEVLTDMRAKEAA